MNSFRKYCYFRIIHPVSLELYDVMLENSFCLNEKLVLKCVPFV